MRLFAVGVCVGVPAPAHACARAGVAWGAANTNACPAGSYVIVDEAQCRAAAATAGKGWYGSGSYSNRPRGCSGATAGSVAVLFNTHPTGAANPYSQPLCAAGTTGVRTR